MGTSRMNEIRRNFDSRDVMAERLADAVSEKLTEAVKVRGQASLSVGGGRFPKPFFRKLADRQVPWDKVTVVLGDERWVSPDDDASNEKLVRENLLQGSAADAEFVGLKTAHEKPESGLSEIEDRLRALPSVIDVTVVGMGEDGHTASLFPSASASELSQALNPANEEQAALMHPTVSDVPRITLTLPRLKASRWLVVAAPGDGKLKTFEAAMQGDDILAMPVRALLQQVDVPVEFWWAP